MPATRINLARVLVTGAGGMIGRAISFGIKVTHADGDVRRREIVEGLVRTHRPEAILHLAAIDIYRAEANPVAACAVNVLGTHTVAAVARAAGIPLIFLSSGAVFNGAAGAVHDETATPDPVNVYGQTKRMAEILLMEMLPDLLIIRTGWVFGGDQAHHQKFVERAMALARADAPIHGIADQWGSPTYVVDLVTALAEQIRAGSRGLLHLVNDGAATGVTMAQEIVAVLQSRSVITPVPASAAPPPAPRRAISEALTSRQVRLRPWQTALREYIVARTAARTDS